MRNNHKWLALLLCMVLVFNCVGIRVFAAQGESPLSLYVSPACEAGGAVAVQVVAGAPGTVADGKLVVTYDPEHLAYTDALTGAAWADGEAVTVSVNPGEGKLILAFASADAASAGCVFTLNFQALIVSNSFVTLEADSYITGVDADVTDRVRVVSSNDCVSVHLNAGSHGTFADGTAETTITTLVGTPMNAGMLAPVVAHRGYALTGWMAQNGTCYALDEDIEPVEGMTLTAQYSYVCDGGESCPSSRFLDLGTLSAEAHASVDYMVEQGYMNGMTTTSFAPHAQLNRAMMVTVLYRIAGSPAVSDACAFTDVSSARYYYDAVIWASENGITNGISDTLFAPEKSLTRQELATFLYRFASYMGYDVSSSADLSGYADADEIGNFAKAAFGWAVAEGIIKGTSVTTLAPQATTTRGQVCLMVYRLLSAQN